MVIPNEVIGYAVTGACSVAVAVVGTWKVAHRNGRNGKNGRCPQSLQDRHGERLVRLETQMETTNATLSRIEATQTTIEATMTTILGRLP